MSNRLILGAHAGTHVLRVSRPGYNVLDEGLPAHAIAFDSRWAQAGNLLLAGQLSLSPGLATLWLPRVLTERPALNFLYVWSDGSLSTYPQNQSAYIQSETYTDRVTFRAHTNLAIRYVVLTA